MIDETIRQERQGDEFEGYRPLLFSIAYRMTGSASDAEDLVQETFLRYQSSAGQEILSLKAFLSTIVTRLSLDYLKSARVTREQYVGAWLPEPILTQADSGFWLGGVEQRESLSLAFMRLLETLTPPERAVFLLHEVFDYPFNEVGQILEKSPANCRQIFHRARQALQDKRARFEAEPQRQRQLLFSFLSASQAGDMATLTNLLAQDVSSWSDGGGKVQTNLKPVFGQAAVAKFWTFWLNLNRPNAVPLTFTVADNINGGPAILVWDGDRLGIAITVSVGESGIEEIDALLNPEKLAYLQKQLGENRGEPVEEPARKDN